jgi:hypothetical protein
MVDGLLSKFGRHDTVALLGIPWITIRGWQSRRRKPDAGSCRAIWLVWCMVFHPDWLASVEDIISWGRFKLEVQEVERPACEWSEWSI